MPPGNLERTFAIWKQSTDAAVLVRLQYEQAAEHHRGKLLLQMWLAWRQYQRHNIHKQVGAEGKGQDHIIIGASHPQMGSP